MKPIARTATWLFFIGVFALPLPAFADIDPVGGQFVVVDSEHTGPGFAPQPLVDAQGNFVIIWWQRPDEGNGCGAEALCGQRFDADGTRIGQPFFIAEYQGHQGPFPASGDDSAVAADTGAYQATESAHAVRGGSFGQQYFAAMDDAGNFVVVWNTRDSVSDPRRVLMRRYDADGTPGEPVTLAGGDLFEPKPFWPMVAMDRASGRSVVVWQVWRTDVDGNPVQIFARRYDAHGQPRDEEPIEVAWANFFQNRPLVAISQSDSFLVDWADRENHDSAARTFIRYFDADGMGGEIIEQEYPENASTYSPRMDAQGNYIDTYRLREVIDGVAGNAVYARKYNPQHQILWGDIRVLWSPGGAPGSEFPVPTRSIDRAGNLIVTMGRTQLIDGDTSRRVHDVVIGAIAANGRLALEEPLRMGTPLGEPERMGTHGTALNDNGDLVVAWTWWAPDELGQQERQLRAQRLSADFIGELFSDRFE